MESLTDEALMERFCQGDTAAFDVLFERHAAGVQGFLHRMVRDPALAEDLLQTTFLSVVRSRGRYEKSTRFTSWLITIAANAARDALRHRHYVQDALEEAASEATQPTTVAPQVGDPGMRRRLEDALQALPAPQREAVVLHKVEGWSFVESAQAVGVSVAAARIRAHRGYERLRALLADVGEEA